VEPSGRGRNGGGGVSDTPRLRRFDKFTAVFSPARRDDLQDGAAALIGKRLSYQAAWIIEDGPYAGQWACSVLNGLVAGDRSWSFAWAPLSDLSDIELDGRPGAA
jgi:hypothetical protein